MRCGLTVVFSLFATLSAVACGSASSVSGPSSPSGGDSALDAVGDAALDAAGDEALDSPALNLGDGGGLSCGQSAAAYCAAHPCTESAVVTSLCAHVRVLSFDCGGLHAVTDGVQDASSTYYFEPSTGDLVAVVGAIMVVNGGSGETCVAGPPTFVEPSCRGVVMVPDCPDAGADAITADH